MLNPNFYETYRVTPTPWFTAASSLVFAANAGLARTRLKVEGWDSLPDTPVMFATNSTQKNDFMAFRWVARGAKRPCVTVTKAKNYHHPAMRFALRRLGVVPLASKGYFLVLDFVRVMGRRPDDAEYRALRDHVDRGAPLPEGAPYRSLRDTPRTLLDHPFDPQQSTLRAFHQGLYAWSLGETVRLAREAVASGYDVQMYPEGTVAPRLGTGRHGVLQLAWALGLDIVPVGMSGCPGAFAGDSPMLRVRGGDVTIRIGAPIRLAPDLLPAGYRPFHPEDEAAQRDTLNGFVRQQLMPAIDGLLDPPYQSRADEVFVGKGTKAFL